MLRESGEWLSKINECFISFTPDPLENINRLTSLCGEFFGATCALYNRLDQGLLCSWGQWNTPPDYNPVDKPDGHICYDVIKNASDKVLVVSKLQESHYAQTDPNVVPFRLQTYVGKAVKFSDTYIGSLCTVFQNDFVPTEANKELMGVIASAIGVEEERRQSVEALKKAQDELERKVKERTFELAKANEQLEIKVHNHSEANTALNVLLKKRDKDKIDLEKKVLLNVREMVVPYLEKLIRSGLNDRQKAFADILESNLTDIVSPFLHTLSSRYSIFTPKEIQVAGLVKEGKTTKEIAILLTSSTDTIDFHRKNIRKKLGLKNTKSNLRSYLLSLS